MLKWKAWKNAILKFSVVLTCDVICEAVQKSPQSALGNYNPHSHSSLSRLSCLQFNSGLFGSLAPKHTFDIVNVDLVKASTGGMLSITVKNTGSAAAQLVKVSKQADGGPVEYVAG